MRSQEGLRSCRRWEFLCSLLGRWGFGGSPTLTSMTNCPEYVPVMVELCPAARIPTAQM